jgi:hypothetical protein
MSHPTRSAPSSSPRAHGRPKASPQALKRIRWALQIGSATQWNRSQRAGEERLRLHAVTLHEIEPATVLGGLISEYDGDEVWVGSRVCDPFRDLRCSFVEL